MSKYDEGFESGSKEQKMLMIALVKRRHDDAFKNYERTKHRPDGQASVWDGYISCCQEIMVKLYDGDVPKAIQKLASNMQLSEWIDVEGYCATRVIAGTDPTVVENRVAFIEKSPRVKLDSGEWFYGPKGSSGFPNGLGYGKYQPSRDWCDEQLVKMGYTLA